MKLRPLTSSLVLGLLLCLLLPLCLRASPAPAWEPIPPEDLAAKECSWQPEAKAEHLLVEQSIHDKLRDHHQRTKFYKVDDDMLVSILTITYTDEEGISELYVRVVKPDGRTSEYSRKDFKEGLALKTTEGKVRKLSASFGDISDGDIVEMKWRRSTRLDEEEMLWGYCQDIVPTRLYRVHLKTSERNCSAEMYNVEHREVTKPQGNEVLMVGRNIPAFQQEPMSRPMRDLRGWFGFFFRSDHYASFPGSALWKELSMLWHEDFLGKTKAKGSLKAKATELVAASANDTEKLRRLYEYCRENISNFDYMLDANLSARKKKRDGNTSWNCMDTFNAKCGYSRDITFLFGAMARAVGFDVRLCISTSRRSSTVIAHGNGYYFLNDPFVGVRSGDKWTLYAPGDYFVPAGMISESNEFAPYLRCFPKTIDIGINNGSPASSSPLTRKGRFHLDIDGTLEGNVEMTFGGHEAINLRMLWCGSMPEEVDTGFKEAFTASMPGAEVGELAWTGLWSLEPSVRVSFHLRIPGYAESIGDRLTVPPGVFCRYNKPIFSAQSRTHDIMFDHARTEADDIEIILPKGYMVEAASAPNPVVAKYPVLSADYTLSFQEFTGTIVYSRRFIQCRDGALAYKVSSYEAFRRLAELIHQSDIHEIICRQKAAVSSSSPASAKP